MALIKQDYDVVYGKYMKYRNMVVSHNKDRSREKDLRRDDILMIWANYRNQLANLGFLIMIIFLFTPCILLLPYFAHPILLTTFIFPRFLIFIFVWTVLFLTLLLQLVKYFPFPALKLLQRYTIGWSEFECERVRYFSLVPIWVTLISIDVRKWACLGLL